MMMMYNTFIWIYNLYYVRDQILAPEFHFPWADFIYTCKQPDYSEQNLSSYAIVTLRICHIQLKIMHLSKHELGFQYFAFQPWSRYSKKMDASLQNKLLK